MALPWQPLIVLLLINTASAQSRSAKADTPLAWQPWLVGFTAVIVFLFIVFFAMIIKKVLHGKNKETDDSCLGLNTEERSKDIEMLGTNSCPGERNKETDDSCLGLNTEERSKDIEMLGTNSCPGERSKKAGDSSRDLTIEER
ncbi:small integral membrane protein 24-like [Amblyraja radiata]|uniref:small integral membrane protein 24-like n=1 Tax=Amblyraja radiata TaxID=386614 RepID=UPI001402BBB9|nr:small integral membrane protein 24-like [Amblyraja radiata]